MPLSLVRKFILLLGSRPYCFLFLLFSISLAAQSPALSIIQTCDSDKKISEVSIQPTKDKTSQQQLELMIAELIKESYLESSIDSIVTDTLFQEDKAYLHVGPRYDFESLVLDSLSVDLLAQLDIDNPRTGEEFVTMRNRLAGYYADNGYPFAMIRLQELNLQGGIVSGTMMVEEGRKIIMDSIIIHGDVEIRQGYLKNYLDLHKGEAFNQTNVKAVQRKLDKLAFLKTEQEPALSFIYDYASLNLYVKAKNTSRFDMIFGVIPTNQVMGKQLFLSLDLSAELLNKLGYGEYFYFNYERLRPEQQKLDFKFNYPYLLDTPFAIDAKFDIRRNALNFQTVHSDLGVQYLINSTDYVSLTWNVESSKIIQVDTMELLTTGMLPDDLSVTQSGIAVEFFKTGLDHRFNPRRGYALKLGLVAGQRKILLDQSILSLSTEAIDFQKQYENLDLVAPRFQFSTHTSIFRPIARRGTVGLQLRGGWRYTTDADGLRNNEKFQIGGNQLLRGFDEASIFTSYYAVSTLEYRLLLSENSYFSAPFVDVGYVESVEDAGSGDVLIGLGAGLIFETKVGMFNFSIAVGRGQGQGFDFGRPKAHFGFTSLF